LSHKLFTVFILGRHPVVYRQLFIVLVPTINNICTDQLY